MTDNSSQEKQSISNLTIEEVLDIKTGQYINCHEFLSLPENILQDYRYMLETAIQINQPRFVCPYCGQMVRLSGRATEKGHIRFFSHRYDSDYCEIKTKTGLTEDEINARKYGRVQESERLINIRKSIISVLNSHQSAQAGITDIKENATVKSNIPFLNWRRPDIQFQYQGKEVVFELQLSTTFASVIVARDIFYRLNNMFVIWVFNFDDNQEYFNLQNLMAKDIYYANKRNVFIYDKEAQRKSEKEGKLYLNCRWMKNDETFSHNLLVPFEELQFDYELNKLYYYDADKDYLAKHPEQLKVRQDTEYTKQELTDALMKKMELEESRKSEELKKRKLEKENIIKYKDQVKPFCKNRKWGYIHNGVIMCDNQYSEASEINDLGVGFIKQSGKYGLVDKTGEVMVPCDYKQIHPITHTIILVEFQKNWYLLNNERPLKTAIADEEITVTDVGFDIKKLQIGYDHFVIFADENWIAVDEIENFKEDGLAFLKLKSRETKPGWRMFNGRWYKTKPRIIEGGIRYLTKEGYIIKDFQGEFAVAMNCEGLYGVIDNDHDLVIPFEFNYLYLLDNGLLVFKEDGKAGLMDIVGEVMVEPAYDFFHVKQGKIIPVQNKKQGLMDEEYNIVLPCIAERVEPFENEDYFYKVKKDGLWGVVTANKKWFIKAAFDEISYQKNGIFECFKKTSTRSNARLKIVAKVNREGKII